MKVCNRAHFYVSYETFYLPAAPCLCIVRNTFTTGALAMPKASPNPTTKTYTSLDDAFAFFNARLFAGRLPACLITMQRSKTAYGYFAGGRFGSKDGQEVTDEIALNPSHFRDRSTEQS